MPSQSEKQHRFMQAVAHNPKFAKKAGVPQPVGKDFESADKASGKYQKGKSMANESMANESINQFIGLVTSGNKDEANAVFQDAIMDKVAARLESLRADVAREYFNFKASKGDNGGDNGESDEKDDNASRDNGESDEKDDNASPAKDTGKDTGNDKKNAVLAKLRNQGGLSDLRESAFLFEEHSGDYEDLTPEARELEIHADNTMRHYNQSNAILANLQKKKNKGIYKPELAQKLWRHHSDAVRKDYNKTYGGNSIPVSASKEHAAFLEKYHRENTLE